MKKKYEYLEPKKVYGKNKKILAYICPFCKDEVPSFLYHKGKDIFKCFACGKEGVIKNKSKNI